MKKILLVIVLFSLAFLFMGCSTEENGNGVKSSNSQWNQRQTQQIQAKHLRGQFSDQF